MRFEYCWISLTLGQYIWQSVNRYTFLLYWKFISTQYPPLSFGILLYLKTVLSGVRRAAPSMFWLFPIWDIIFIICLSIYVSSALNSFLSWQHTVEWYLFIQFPKLSVLVRIFNWLKFSIINDNFEISYLKDLEVFVSYFL